METINRETNDISGIYIEVLKVNNCSEKESEKVTTSYISDTQDNLCTFFLAETGIYAFRYVKRKGTLVLEKDNSGIIYNRYENFTENTPISYWFVCGHKYSKEDNTLPNAFFPITRVIDLDLNPPGFVEEPEKAIVYHSNIGSGVYFKSGRELITYDITSNEERIAQFLELFEREKNNKGDYFAEDNLSL